MKSHILEHQNERSQEFRPNPKLDGLICTLAKLLGPVQEMVNSSHASPEKPVVVIVGCPRSGTTFMTQLLAATGAFSYPSNLLSRFAFAPHLGALIQQLLLDPDYDLGCEFTDLRSSSGFSSNVGKTEGALGINEFFHFWRRFFPNHDPGFLTDAELDAVALNQLNAELASIQAAFGKSFMSKGMMMQYNLAFFAKYIPALKIVHVKREPLYVMQSICQARSKYYGTDRIWWSVKPREYEYLKDKDPLTQVAGQVLFTDQEIMKQSEKLENDRFIMANYESVCDNPKDFLQKMATQFSMPDLENGMAKVDDVYTSGNSRRLSDATLDDLERRYAELSRLSTLGPLI